MENEVEKFVKERLGENEKLFTKKEFKCIEENESIIKKIYLLGFIDARQCYKKEY